MNTLEDYRKGAIGALMDEYERVAYELENIVLDIEESNYKQIADSETTDERCRSMQTIMSHVVTAGYGYANYICEQFSMNTESYEDKQISHQEIGDEIDKMLAFTIKTLDGKWEMPYKEINALTIKSHWGVNYDLEQMLEHAIVHISRHRRQIEKFLLILNK